MYLLPVNKKQQQQMLSMNIHSDEKAKMALVISPEII
jgi:hypothetical protein